MKATQRSWTLVILSAVQFLIIMLGVSALVVLAWAYLSDANADPYVRTTGGCIWSSDQSNDDDLEFGSECGAMVSAEGGYRFSLAEDLAIDAGLEVAHRWKDLHGQNGNGRATADGNTLHLTSFMVNGRLSYNLYGPVSLYVEGGAGGAHLLGLDAVALTPAWQAGGGLEFSILDNLSAHAGYRHFEIMDTSLDGNSTGADFHGAVVGFRWSFVDFMDYRSDLLED